MAPTDARTALRRARLGAVLLAGFALALLSAGPAGGGEPAPPPPLRLTILHTNDMHGHLDERPLGKDREPGGGIARIAGAVFRIRREVEAAGGFAVLADAGDFYAGTPEGNLTRGRLVVELMNAAGCDLACPGNHEFDDGPENLAKLSELARFPFTAANVREKGSGAPPPWARACVYRDFGNVRAAFVGLLTPETGIITTGAGTFEFEDEAAALRRVLARARAEGAVLCVVLSHLGIERDRELSAAVPEVPLIVGAHSHTTLKRGWRNEKTGVLVVQAGSSATVLGRVDLEVERATGRVLSAEARLVPLSGDDAPADEAVARALDRGAAGIRKAMETVLGESEHEVARGGGRFSGASSPLGSWIAELIREAAGAQVGFQNRGGVRDVLPRGPVTMRHVFEICPFANTVVGMDLTGRHLLALMETALRESDRFLLEVSGLEVEYDPSREPGARVLSAQVGGKPLDPEAVYRVATNSFLADGGDGHPAFLEGRNRKDTGIFLRDLLANKVREGSPLKVEYRNRIRRVPEGK